MQQFRPPVVPADLFQVDTSEHQRRHGAQNSGFEAWTTSLSSECPTPNQEGKPVKTLAHAEQQ